VRLFALEKIHRKNASFDLDKCIWLNGEYVRELGDDRFHNLARQALEKSGIDLSKFSPNYVHAALETCMGKFKIFSELPGYCSFYFNDDFEYYPDGIAKHFVPENKSPLLAVREAFAALDNFDAPDLEAALKATAAQLSLKIGALVHPTRLAVTGSNAGPSLYHLLEILGKEKVLARLDRALAMF
jgi:glutamyl-tRNA synthetase